MAKVKIEEIIDHLDSEMKKALEDTFTKMAPSLKIDKNTIFREFIKAVRKRCSTWETVPDHFVESDD